MGFYLVPMQFKKDYTYNNIVEVAKKIFLRDGFAKTSMRDIAKGAGIGVSNIYNYFESKDELFKHIVAPLIAELEKMMNEHHNMKSYDQFLLYARGESDEVININVQDYMRLLNNFRDELKLILYKAQGSSLETFMDEYSEKCTQQVVAFMDEFKNQYPEFSTVRSPFTYHIHMTWMFSFISEVIKHDLTPQEIRSAIEDYILFEYAGWRMLIKPNPSFPKGRLHPPHPLQGE